VTLRILELLLEIINLSLELEPLGVPSLGGGGSFHRSHHPWVEELPYLPQPSTSPLQVVKPIDREVGSDNN
jgi:hypothetical protein